MKKIVKILLVAVIFSALMYSAGTTYAQEPEVIWLENDYNVVGPFSEGLAKVSWGKKWGFIDSTGKEVVPLKYDLVGDFSEGLAWVGVGTKSGEREFGYIDRTGKEVIPISLSATRDFTEGTIIVSKVVSVETDEGLVEVGKLGLMNKSGEMVTPFIYDNLYKFSDGLARARIGDQWRYIDNEGNEVLVLDYDYVDDFSEGLAAVNIGREEGKHSGGKNGYINKSGELVVDIKYDYANKFSEGLAKVGIIGGESYAESGYIDKTGKVVIPIIYPLLKNHMDDFSSGVTRIIPDHRYNLMDKTGKIIPLRAYNKVNKFSEGLARVQVYGMDGWPDDPDARQGFIDATGKEVIPLKYYWATEFSDGYSIVRAVKGGKYGILRSPLKKQEPISNEKAVETTIATPTPSKVVVDGAEKDFDAYLIYGNNYFKLRDLATVVDRTEKQFDVSWDDKNKAINLISGKSYTPVGGEMVGGKAQKVESTLNNSTIYKDGSEIELVSYNINGNNYFKLRDIASAFDIGVTWDDETKTIGINTAFVPKDTAEENETTNKIQLTHGTFENPIVFSSGEVADGAIPKYFSSEEYGKEFIRQIGGLIVEVDGVLIPAIPYSTGYDQGEILFTKYTTGWGSGYKDRDTFFKVVESWRGSLLDEKQMNYIYEFESKWLDKRTDSSGINVAKGSKYDMEISANFKTLNIGIYPKGALDGIGFTVLP